MADKELSPEKQLLNIIESQQKQGDQGQEEKPVAVSPVKKSKKYLSASSLKGRIAFFKDKLKKGPAKISRISFDLRSINIFLQFCIVISAIGLAVGIKIEVSNLNKAKLITIPNLVSEAQAEPVVASFLKPESYYLEKARARDLFKLDDIQAKKPSGFKEEDPKVSKLQEMSKNLKLVGISWAKDPEAIIEDITLKSTHFVKVGYMIGEIKVQSILKDKVILRYEGDEVEIR